MLPRKSLAKIKDAMTKLAQDAYGPEEYGKKNDRLTNKYFPKGDVEIYNDANIATGLFSIGNSKLADNQTLIMNFTSALGCPSLNDCPITQKACYAVAGENRLPSVRRKNLIVQSLFTHLRAKNMLGSFFDVAELYIVEAEERTKKPIKYIRYNEVGDFIDQAHLIKCAEFSQKVRDKYGVISMAYTANPRLDLSEMVNGEPIDAIIAINRSRDDIKTSPDALNRNFYGIPMNNFSSNPDVNLQNAYCDVEYVEDDDLNHLKVEVPLMDKHGSPSVPVLNKGSWAGGSGYYYVCPCSFWAYNKDKATKNYMVKIGAMSEDEEIPQNRSDKKKLKDRLTQKQQKELKSLLNKIKSPCGIKCSVCHDLSGGVTKDGKSGIKDYVVLTATHGAGASNYDPTYADAKRRGDDTAVWKGDKSNPRGRKRKYNTNTTIRKELLKNPEEKVEESRIRRITEGQLHRLIRECVHDILRVL